MKATIKVKPGGAFASAVVPKWKFHATCKGPLGLPWWKDGYGSSREDAVARGMSFLRKKGLLESDVRVIG